MPTLEEIRSLFTGDRFATECAGAVIDAAEPGRSVCSAVPWIPTRFKCSSMALRPASQA